jgi:hypothetical protein
MIDDLIYDITIRFPKDSIIFRGDAYYIFEGSSGKFTHVVPEDVINELLERKFVIKNKHNGLLLTENILVYSDKLQFKTKQIESHKEPGQFYAVSDFKERWVPMK